MRRRTGFACMAALVVVLAGCGSTKKAADSTPTAPKAAAGAPTAPKAVARPLASLTYRVRLAGLDAAHGASGVASISIEASRDKLCWKFSGLRHVTFSSGEEEPAIAVIQATPAGIPATPGALLGIHYASSACLTELATYLKGLEADPSKYYLSIYNLAHGGALRGDL